MVDQVRQVRRMLRRIDILCILGCSMDREGFDGRCSIEFVPWDREDNHCDLVKAHCLGLRIP
jgi:hypothetical protein